MSDRYDAVRSKAVAVAISEMRSGVREIGAEDRGPAIDRYATNARSGLSLREGVPGRQWCGMFIYWCYSVAAREEGVPLPFAATDLWSGQRLFRFASHLPSVIVPTEEAVLPGDIYVAQSNHIGMAIAYHNAELFKAIDGNQSSADSGHSAITENLRHYSGCRVLVRI